MKHSINKVLKRLQTLLLNPYLAILVFSALILILFFDFEGVSIYLWKFFLFLYFMLSIGIAIDDILTSKINKLQDKIMELDEKQ